MNKIGHLLFGAVFFLVVYMITTNYYEINNNLLPILLIVSLIYSLLPDIDKNNSWIKKKLNFVIYIMIIFSIILYFLKQLSITFIFALIAIEVILLFVKHRGIIHSIGFGILLSIPLLLAGKFYFFAGVVGYFSHLIADSI